MDGKRKILSRYKFSFFVLISVSGIQGVPKKGTNSKRKPHQKLSAIGQNFPIDMTWERLSLLNLLVRNDKIQFPDTKGAGYW